MSPTNVPLDIETMDKDTTYLFLQIDNVENQNQTVKAWDQFAQTNKRKELNEYAELIVEKTPIMYCKLKKLQKI